MKLFKKEIENNRVILTFLGLVKIKLKRKYSNNYCCIYDETTKIYNEAQIVNLSNDINSIVIGANTHVLAQLHNYPHGGKIKIGEYCYLGDHTRIWANESIEIGNNVLIAHNVNIFDSTTHPIDPVERHELQKIIYESGFPPKMANVNSKPVKICDNAWIGCMSVILRGVTVGEAAIVSAGSIVTKDVEPYTIVAGNPAKKIGDVPRKQ